MSELDALAWMIIGVTVIFVVLPLIFYERDGNPNHQQRNYWESVRLSITFVLLIGSLVGSVAVICWALNRVLFL